MAKSAAGSTPAGAPPRTNRRGRRISYHLAAPVGGVNFQASNCTVLAPGTAAPGTAVQFTDKGAQKLTNMHLVLIFWGVDGLAARSLRLWSTPCRTCWLAPI